MQKQLDGNALVDDGNEAFAWPSIPKLLLPGRAVPLNDRDFVLEEALDEEGRQSEEATTVVLQPGMHLDPLLIECYRGFQRSKAKLGL